MSISICNIYAHKTVGGILVPVMTDSIIFNVSGVSLPESVPLVSKPVIAPTRNSINGTEVMCTCTDVVTNAASSTTVFIINLMLQDCYLLKLLGYYITKLRSPCGEFYLAIDGL